MNPDIIICGLCKASVEIKLIPLKDRCGDEQCPVPAQYEQYLQERSTRQHHN